MNPVVVLDADELRLLRRETHLSPMASAVFRVEGAGALQCVQGIFTNDVIKRPPDALVWGGVLTAKGMIIFDMWVLRDGDAAWMIVPADAHDAATHLFGRTFPPRIARVSERTATMTVECLLGPMPAAVPLPLAMPGGPAPFTGLLISGDGRPTAPSHGLPSAPAAWIDAARLLAGWPTLGREIDDRTLPQEVRFDELDGVRYDKGCYTGQETVARLHFRGHANRTLRGLRWSDDPPQSAVVTSGGREVGTIATLGIVGTDTIGLAKLRREVATGDTVVAGEREAQVVELPFGVA